FKIHSLTRIPQNMPIRLSLIQANISPYQKWEEDFKDKIIEKYISLTQRTAKKNPALVVWPETSFPGFWEEERLLREGVLSLAKEIKTDILIGSPTWEKGLSYNSAILISDEGREISRYHKVHLVPFGEYLPFPKIFGFLQKRFSIGDYAQGKEYTIFRRQLPWTTYHFSILICFEDIFPNLVRSFVKNGAEFLINITEDGWYGKSSASFQHLQALVLRAVENRRYMVRSANTGYSCVINPWGKIVSELKDEQGEKLFITGVHTGDVFSNSRKTFYTLFGDWFIYLCFISFFLILYKRKKSLNLCLLLL
ncbi:MAG: apolipoprotein N-acyltransferase, partial [Candidatus Omnitrophica bacterium]|nr:apolipoprotein N-acyltransferase [Candidatus Omnitrophota bacterium]